MQRFRPWWLIAGVLVGCGNDPVQMPDGAEPDAGPADAAGPDAADGTDAGMCVPETCGCLDEPGCPCAVAEPVPSCSSSSDCCSGSEARACVGGSHCLPYDLYCLEAPPGPELEPSPGWSRWAFESCFSDVAVPASGHVELHEYVDAASELRVGFVRTAPLGNPSDKMFLYELRRFAVRSGSETLCIRDPSALSYTVTHHHFADVATAVDGETTMTLRWDLAAGLPLRFEASGRFPPADLVPDGCRVRPVGLTFPTGAGTCMCAAAWTEKLGT